MTVVSAVRSQKLHSFQNLSVTFDEKSSQERHFSKQHNKLQLNIGNLTSQHTSITTSCFLLYSCHLFIISFYTECFVVDPLLIYLHKVVMCDLTSVYPVDLENGV